MTVPYILLAFLSLIVLVIAVGIGVGIGAHVVKKYPDRHDPDRNAKRYTAPAGIAALVAFVAFVALLVFTILALVA